MKRVITSASLLLLMAMPAFAGMDSTDALNAREQKDSNEQILEDRMHNEEAKMKKEDARLNADDAQKQMTNDAKDAQKKMHEDEAQAKQKLNDMRNDMNEQKRSDH